MTICLRVWNHNHSREVDWARISIGPGVLRQNRGNVNSVLIPRTPAARQCWEPRDSKALELVGIGFRHALRLKYSRFHRVGHVNCSGFPCRNGNFHLGRSPEHPISGLPAAPGQRELLPPRGGWHGAPDRLEDVATERSAPPFATLSGSSYTDFTHLSHLPASFRMAKSNRLYQVPYVGSAFW